MSAIMAVSFVTAALTAVLMNCLFWISAAVFAGTCLYVIWHEKDLDADLDDIFGRGDDLR